MNAEEEDELVTLDEAPANQTKNSQIAKLSDPSFLVQALSSGKIDLDAMNP